MIKLETAHIEELRGIRKLNLDFNKDTFAISGPNGSGKSGVIDAIEFGLTGEIGRLMGRGTKGLSVAEHAPHVDKTKFPDAAFVELKVFLPGLGKSATITRKVSSPHKPKIVPDDPDIRHVLAEVANHPEMTLSRREILRFILVEPTKRSEEIQTILKLEEIGQVRAALNTAQNKVVQAQKLAAAQVDTHRAALQRHLLIATLRQEDVLKAVNTRRQVLGLMLLTELTADSKVDAGLAEAAKAPQFNKESAVRDLRALVDAAKGFPDLAKVEVATLLGDLQKLEADPALFDALQRRAFVKQGLELVDSAECPLCDTPWEEEANLRAHITAKLAKSEEAGKIQSSLVASGTSMAGRLAGIVGLLTPVQRVAESEGDKPCAQLVADWKTDLESLKTKLGTVNGIAGIKQRLVDGWLQVPVAFGKMLNSLTQAAEAKPDQTATVDGQTFLTTAQVRLTDYREALRKNKAAEIACAVGKAAYEIYCEVLEDELNALYEEVQKDFSTFYREINQEDEVTFTAKLTPTEGSLALDVNFYDRGLFPPAAYHSEGHQDGMGVCLYLALMKRLFGDNFTFALLDDVVMSVDSSHRYEFCKLLKTHFANTQFLITTHDRLWAAQMKSAGLVTSKTSLVFQGWTIDGGPVVESDEEIWTEIASALTKGKVSSAAASLRHHLEFVSRHLADQLGASPQFRADGNYELGELMPSVLGRMKDVYSKAAEAAQSWGNTADKEVALNRKKALSSSNAATGVEQWAVNKAVHYNEWANFNKKDFEPVVAAFQELLGCFTCEKCHSWLYVIPPRGTSESLRCPCSAVNLNLKAKGK